MYADTEISFNDYPTFERSFTELDERNTNAARKIYGMVSNIDDNIGRVLAKLDELQIRDNTLVIFMTDNGPQQYRYTAGMRGLKGTVYEGGIHVPFFEDGPPFSFSICGCGTVSGKKA